MKPEVRKPTEEERKKAENWPNLGEGSVNISLGIRRKRDLPHN